MGAFIGLFFHFSQAREGALENVGAAPTATVEHASGQNLILLVAQSYFGDKPLRFLVVCPQNGTAVLKELIRSTR